MWGAIVGGIGAALGAAGLIMGHNEYKHTREAANRQKQEYERQLSINRQIAKFNNRALDFTSNIQVGKIQGETERVLKSEIATFRSRGVSLEGSPMFVLGETANMGAAKIQELLFNTEVKKKNMELSAEVNAAAARAGAESANIMASEARIGMISNAMKSMKGIIGGIGQVVKYFNTPTEDPTKKTIL